MISIGEFKDERRGSNFPVPFVFLSTPFQDEGDKQLRPFSEEGLLHLLTKTLYGIIKILAMAKLENLQTYYILYNAIREIPRYKLKYLAEILELSGRGKTYTTASNYVSKLYEREISFFPNLILRTYENCFTKAYFLRVNNPQNITEMFLKLSRNKALSYMLLLSGRYDFFVASKYDLAFEEGLTVKKKSILYTPMYTHPLGWDLEVKDAFRKVADSSPLKGRLERKMEDWLPWEKVHFDIFETMRNNVQLPFSTSSLTLQIR